MTARRSRPRFALTHVFAATIAAVVAVVGALSYRVLDTTRRSLVDRSERFRAAAAQRIETRVAHDLGEATSVVDDIERALRAEAVHADAPLDLEALLFVALSNHADVAEISVTHAVKRAYDAKGDLELEPSDRWQIALYRAKPGPASGLDTRVVRREGDRFVAELRERAPGSGLRDGVVSTQVDAADPTRDLTFQVTVAKQSFGRAIWSDLHWWERDRDLPDRRVVLTAQKAIEGAGGRFVGVVRVALLASTIDDLARLRVDEGDAADPHRVFLTDPKGRLVTRLGPEDRRAVSGDDLRVTGSHLPAEVARALESATLPTLGANRRVASESFDANGQHYLLTWRWLGTQDWIAGIVVPEAHYTRDLRELRDRFLAVGALGLGFALLSGILLLRTVRSGFRRLLATTGRMRSFDFAPDASRAALREIDEVVESLERAKTAVRALGKYVPVDLVRDLYASNREPALGGELATITLMFTDIQGFTELSEVLAPNQLAEALGRYLEAMTEAVRATGGTIDKFIGDSVMAMWNAPSRLPDHPTRACRAALACEQATRSLYASEAWRGLPALTTRFGLHTDTVMVGNFGAPARLAFTALGDGVNLASRLEGLCKQYGIVRMASEAVEREARASFVFRRLDRVAVKGKTRAVVVFELLGPAGTTRGAAIEAYEAALDDYFGRRFAQAMARLEPHAASDEPSRVLLERCRALRIDPPPEDWDGAWVARSK